jgi:hypothetical protein
MKHVAREKRNAQKPLVGKHTNRPLARLRHKKVYPKVSGPTAWSEDCKWNTSLPLGAVVSLFRESV